MNLVFLLIVVAGIVLLVMQQQGKLPFVTPKPKLSPQDRNIFNLEIGDIVQHDGIDWFVEGKLIYSDTSESWFEYLLRDDDRILWLAVEEDDFVEVSLLKEVDFLNISIPPEKVITVENIEYSLVDSGTATAMRLGNTLNRQEQKCEYYDYKGSGLHRLSVEVWGNDIEVTVGQKINPKSLGFLPGDGQKVYG